MGEQYEGNVHLCSATDVIAFVTQTATPVICHQVAGKKLELYVVRVAAQGSEIVQSDRGEVDFACELCIVVGAYLVDACSRHGVDRAESVHFAVIHIVVAETAEE